MFDASDDVVELDFNDLEVCLKNELLMDFGYVLKEEMYEHVVTIVMDWLERKMVIEDLS